MMGLVHSLGNTLLTFDLPYFVSQGQVCMLLQVISGLPTFAFQSPILKRQESLRRNGVAIMVNKRVRNAVLGCNLKNDRMISVLFQGKPFNITVIQVYTLTNNAEEAEVE